MSAISRDEWLRAMEEAGLQDMVDDQSAMTVIEFADMFAIDRNAAARRLRQLHHAGRAVKTQKRCPDSRGRIYFQPAWKLVGPPKKKRR